MIPLEPVPAVPLSDAHDQHFRTLVRSAVQLDQHGMIMNGSYAMLYAEQELMYRHAVGLVEPDRTDLLEIGFGLGVFAQEANLLGLRSYTCVELHPAVASFARHLLRPFSSHPCSILEGAWQKVLAGSTRSYDAVMLDPTSPMGHGHDDFVRLVRDVLPSILRPGGRFSFFCCGDLNPDRGSAIEDVFAEVRVERVSLAERLPPHWSLHADWFLVHHCMMGRPHDPASQGQERRGMLGDPHEVSLRNDEREGTDR